MCCSLNSIKATESVFIADLSAGASMPQHTAQAMHTLSVHPGVAGSVDCCSLSHRDSMPHCTHGLSACYGKYHCIHCRPQPLAGTGIQLLHEVASSFCGVQGRHCTECLRRVQVEKRCLCLVLDVSCAPALVSHSIAKKGPSQACNRSSTRPTSTSLRPQTLD